MSWKNDMVTILRVIISDLDSDNYTYTDSRLEQIIVVAAHYVKNEINFSTNYTIGIGTPSISPDPTTNNDEVFVNLVLLRAACLTDWSTYRTEALRNGLEAKLGPAELKVKGDRLDGFKTLITDGPCAAYQQLKMQYEFGDMVAVRAVLSPFVGNNFDPISLNYRAGFIDPRE